MSKIIISGRSIDSLSNFATCFKFFPESNETFQFRILEKFLRCILILQALKCINKLVIHHLSKFTFQFVATESGTTEESLRKIHQNGPEILEDCRRVWRIICSGTGSINHWRYNKNVQIAEKKRAEFKKPHDSSCVSLPGFWTRAPYTYLRLILLVRSWNYMDMIGSTERIILSIIGPYKNYKILELIVIYAFSIPLYCFIHFSVYWDAIEDEEEENFKRFVKGDSHGEFALLAAVVLTAMALGKVFTDGFPGHWTEPQFGNRPVTNVVEDWRGWAGQGEAAPFRQERFTGDWWIMRESVIYSSSIGRGTATGGYFHDRQHQILIIHQLQSFSANIPGIQIDAIIIVDCDAGGLGQTIRGPSWLISWVGRRMKMIYDWMCLTMMCQLIDHSLMTTWF